MKAEIVSRGLSITLGLGIAVSGFDAVASHEGEDGDDSEITGTLYVIQVDDFDQGCSDVAYWVEESASGKHYQIHFRDKPRPGMRSGAIVKARGKLRAGGSGGSLLAANGESVQTLQEAAAVVGGEQKTIVLLINFADKALECSQQYVRDLMFTSPNNRSVDDLYQETSFGNIWFTGDVFGPYTINYISTNSCNYNGWASAAESAATSAGVNLSQYARRIYVFPRGSTCGWAGLGTIGGNPSKAWIAYCDLPDVYAHELGHNITMHHASNNSGCEYCDTSDFMGYGGVGLRQVNGPHKEQMGWLPASQIVTATNNGSYNLAPLEVYPSGAVAPQLLKIPRPGTGENYYFAYRRPIGFDASLSSTYADKVNVHRYSSGAVQTYFMTALNDGGTFQDAANGFSVTQVSHGGDYATVEVNFGCATLSPTLSLSPASQTARPGVVLNYTVSVVNGDSAGCAASTFNLTPSVPAGWTAAPSAFGWTLSPGQSATATLAVTSPSSAPSGNYTISASVSDGVTPTHNASANATFVVDATPPTAPSNLTASNKRGKVQLTWGASSDSNGVAGYNVLRGGVQIAQTSSTSYLDGAVTSGQTYSYTVTARDAVGNVSGPSNTATLTVSNSKGGGKPK
jgi:hypothetical protein